MTTKIVLLLTAASLIFGLFAGTIGGLFAFDARMDAKIKRVSDPIATDVRAIRVTLDALLLKMGP